MIKIIKKLLLISFLSNLIITSLYSDIINQLSNKNLSISGYFFSSTKSLYFLRYVNENNSSLWLYTKQRKFKPVHNTKAFDGYDKAGSLFDSIMVEDNNNISISGIINSDGNSNGNDNLYEDIVNKTFIPTHLLLKDSNSNTSSYNILTNKDATSLWEYTGRKYIPIHNAKSFDGYKEAKRLFDDINMSKDNVIHIGNINKDNYISLKTHEYVLSNTRAIRIVKSSDYKDNFVQISSNLIKDKANELIWQNNNDDKFRTYEEAKGYCEGLEVDGYKGFRLPNGLEISALFDEDIDSLELEFINIEPNIGYWSSVELNTRYSSSAYSLKFMINQTDNKDMFLVLDGSFSLTDTNLKVYSKCVYGKELINPIFIRNNDTIIDTSNNLMWQDNLEIRNNQLSIHILAVGYCRNLDFLGYTDWRLPNYKELSTFLPNSNNKSNILNINAKTYHTYIPQNISEKAKKEIVEWVDSMHKKNKTNYSILRDIIKEELGFYYKYIFNKFALDNGVKEYFKKQEKHHMYLVNSISKETLKEIYQTSNFKKKVNQTQQEYYDVLTKYQNAKELTTKEYNEYLKDISEGKLRIGGSIITVVPPIPSDNVLFIEKKLKLKIESDGYSTKAILKSDINNAKEAIKKILLQDNYFNISTLYKLLIPPRRNKASAFWTLNPNIYFDFKRFSQFSSISGKTFCVRDSELNSF